MAGRWTPDPKVGGSNPLRHMHTHHQSDQKFTGSIYKERSGQNRDTGAEWSVNITNAVQIALKN